MENVTYHKLLSGSHTRWEPDKGEKGDWTVYKRGDLIPNLRPEEIESLGADRLEVADKGAVAELTVVDRSAQLAYVPSDVDAVKAVNAVGTTVKAVDAATNTAPLEDDDSKALDTDSIDAILSGSIPEVEAALADIDSKEELEMIRARELSAKGQGRAGVQKAINKRIEALEQ